MGRAILVSAPYMMKGLSILGTVAMFMVGGGIIVHGIPPLHDAVHSLAHHAEVVPVIGGVLSPLLQALINMVAGVITGAIVLSVVMLIGKLFRKQAKAH